MKKADTNTATTTTADPAVMQPGTVPLETPIVRGEHTITQVVLRKPKAGALRGINLSDLLQLRTEAIITLLPRISEPPLIKHEVEAMDPVDLIACASEVLDFLLPTTQLAQARAMAQLSLSE